MTKRLHVVDALRGFAIISIMLLHNIEHFDFYFKPATLPDWMVKLDRTIWDSLFFLFGGKSFAIFALLFGLTFFIQFDNQQNKGVDFRPRFAWRMFLLLCFGWINSAFFQGDILAIYSVVGLFLIPLAKLPNKTLFLIAIILLLQPLEIVPLIHAFQHPEMKLANPQSWTYFGRMKEYIPGDSLIKTLSGNLINGHKAVLLWSYENGRYFQILALFIFGYIIGRKKLFEWTDRNKKTWIRILIIACILFIPFYYIDTNLDSFIPSAAVRTSVQKIWQPFSNLSFMMVLVSSFTLLYHSRFLHKPLNLISPIGKMSLSNYVFQSIVGSILYYGFGFGLYKYTGATYSLLIGMCLSAFFIIVCTYWNKYHKHGPLEGIWHKLTWIKVN